MRPCAEESSPTAPSAGQIEARSQSIPGLHPGDVRGEAVNAVLVEVTADAVAVLCGAWAGVACHDLCVAQRNARVKGVGDRRMVQRAGADVAGDFPEMAAAPAGLRCGCLGRPPGRTVMTAFAAEKGHPDCG